MGDAENMYHNGTQWVAGQSDADGNIKVVSSPSSDSLDAFNRLRVSSPATTFDSKQVFDNLPLFWDDQEVSGSGTTSTWSKDQASSTMAVSNLTAGKRVRQTFQSFDYHPGKSQQVMMTGSLVGAGTGITASMGQFNDDNGLFVTAEDGVVKFVIRSSTSGSAVDNPVPQEDWNLDTFDGNGPSGVELDPTKTQIFVFDYEWLGVGRVRMGWFYHGKIHFCHEFDHANVLEVVYMSTPNLPLRYSIENDGTGGAASMQHLCSTIISEGAGHEEHLNRTVSTNGTKVDANSVGTIYAVKGIRLKTTHIGGVITPIGGSLLGLTNDDYEWFLILNPTKAVDLTWSDVTNSSIQEGTANASSPSTTTLTGGTVIAGGFIQGNRSADLDIKAALKIGAAIDGTRDEIILAVSPLQINLDVHGSITYTEAL